MPVAQVCSYKYITSGGGWRWHPKLPLDKPDIKNGMFICLIIALTKEKKKNRKGMKHGCRTHQTCDLLNNITHLTVVSHQKWLKPQSKFVHEMLSLKSTDQFGTLTGTETLRQTELLGIISNISTLCVFFFFSFITKDTRGQNVEPDLCSREASCIDTCVINVSHCQK